MNKAAILSKIKQYIRTAYAWHESGEAVNSGEGPAGSMSDLEDEILLAFGLPQGALMYSEILQAEGFSIENLHERAQMLYKRLIREARQWLLSPIVHDTRRLHDARLAYSHVQDVLPLMGFACTRYSHFLYYNRFLTGRCSAQELLRCLRIQNDLLSIYRVAIPSYAKDMDNDTIAHLDELELPCLHEYLHYLLDADLVQDWDIKPGDLPAGLPGLKQAPVEIDEFILHAVLLIEPEACFLQGMHWTGTEYRFLFVSCNQEQLMTLLQYAQYPAQVGHLHYMVQQFKPLDEELQYNLLEEDGHNILINRCILRLARSAGNNPDAEAEKGSVDLLGIIPNDGREAASHPFEVMDGDDYPF